MAEESIGEFPDLGVVHFNSFTTEKLLHDPVVAQHGGTVRFICCNNILRLDGLICQCCSLFGESDAIVLVLEECKDQQCISSCWHMSRITSSMHAMWTCVLPVGFNWDFPGLSPFSMMLMS